MEKKKVCRIIEDLLPNYLEGLTNEITNEFIEEHLNECASCQKEKQKMTNKIETKVVNNEQIEIDYMKKYRRKMNILKSIIGIIIIVELIFLVDFCRKFFIILQAKTDLYDRKNWIWKQTRSDSCHGRFSSRTG